MSQTEPAAFRLKNYKFNEFSFQNPTTEIATFDISFKSNGIFITKDHTYTLILELDIAEESNPSNKIYFKVEALFEFEQPISYKEIPEHFFQSALAVIFPYVRAFLSTLTLQANVKPIILPLINMIGMGNGLKENTVEI